MEVVVREVELILELLDDVTEELPGKSGPLVRWQQGTKLLGRPKHKG